jgi:AraC family transcriptional regulator
MKNLKTGQFFGKTNETMHLSGITLTDTEYTHEKVDWHFHENAYFTFILEGRLNEGNKKDFYTCSSGSLIFHNWQEPHYNIKPKGYTRGFHIELKPQWFGSYDVNPDSLAGSLKITDPCTKILMYNIFKETKLSLLTSQSTIDSLLIELFTQMTGTKESAGTRMPGWTSMIRDILYDTPEDLSLSELAALLKIHPVHLSRCFRKYFGCNMGEYIRKIKIQRALSLLSYDNLSLTEIAMLCNFADQSHFIRSFKSQHHITPLQFRKLLIKKN